MSKFGWWRAFNFATILSTGMFTVAAAETIDLEVRSSESNGVKTFDYVKSVDTSIQGDATLVLTVIGDFGGSDGKNEWFEVWLDYTLVIGRFLDEDTSNDDGDAPGDVGGVCDPITITIPIREEDIEPFIEDGVLSIKVQTSSAVSSAGSDCPPGTGRSVSAQVYGSLHYTSEDSYLQEKHEDTVSAATTLTASRTSMTLANLPTLSGRLTGARFGGRPGGAPSGASIRTPTPSLPGGTPAPLPTPTSNPIPAPAAPPPPGGSSGGYSGGSSGGPPQTSPSGGTLTGSGNANQGFVTFSSDLRSLRRASAAHFDASSQDGALSANDADRPFDVWFGGSYSYFDTGVGGLKQRGDVATLQFGVDTRINPNWLVGVAVFGDLLSSDISTGSQTTGVGYLTGPYTVISLDDNLYLEAMAAGGRAFNRITAPGQNDARYTSDRVLLTGRLSGDWAHDKWSFRPSTRLTYYAERQETFTDGLGALTPARTSVLGQMRFGPEVAYDFTWEGAAARPFVGLEGVWAFRQTDQLVNGVGVSGEPFSGSLALGLDGIWSQTSFRAGARYDGIGDADIQSVSGELTIRVPLD